MWANRPGGKSSRGRIVQGRNVQGANRPGGETSRERIVLVANRPGSETSTIGGETSKGRNVKVAKRPVTYFLDKTRQDNVVIGRRRMASMPLNINLTKNNCKQI